jgi:SAGA-associated factor 29
MDIDNGDVPSGAEKHGPRGKASRGSLPPKDSGSGRGSVDPAGSTGVTINAKGRITFPLKCEVAFKLKPQAGAAANAAPEWIQGVVVKVIGEGKSRRYDVQDPEPDEITKDPGQVYRTSAASMVPIQPLGEELPDYEPGKIVLARYPDTTTFYRAEVVETRKGYFPGAEKTGCGKIVKLKFDEDDGETRDVDRRFVLDYKV